MKRFNGMQLTQIPGNLQPLVLQLGDLRGHRRKLILHALRFLTAGNRHQAGAKLLLLVFALVDLPIDRFEALL